MAKIPKALHVVPKVAHSTLTRALEVHQRLKVAGGLLEKLGSQTIQARTSKNGKKNARFAREAFVGQYIAINENLMAMTKGKAAFPQHIIQEFKPWVEIIRKDRNELAHRGKDEDVDWGRIYGNAVSTFPKLSAGLKRFIGGGDGAGTRA